MLELVTALALGLGKALCVVALLLLLLGLDLGQRWKLRHIPGPPALPFLGNLPQVIRLGSPAFFKQCREKYGPVFRIAFGRSFFVVIAEPDLLRQAGTRVLNHALFRSLMRGEFRQLDDLGLVIARDEYWRLVRSAWQPAFSSASLSGYLPRMVGCARQLAERLEARAVEADKAKEEGGEAAAADAAVGRVDIWRELGSMTLQVVGSTAYGVDFHAIETDVTGIAAAAAAAAESGASRRGQSGGQQQQQQQYGRVLVEACRDVFRYSSIVYGSKYSRVSLLLPELRPLVSAAAHAMPDLPFAKLLRARKDLRDACFSLIDGWNARPAMAPGKSGMQPSGGGPTAESAGAANTRPAAAAADGNPGNDSGRHSAAAAEVAAEAAATGADGAEGGGADGVASGKGAAAERELGTPAAEPSAVAAPPVAVGSFLGLILSARDKASGEALTDLQVAAQVQTFILAGYETTANGLAFAVYCIATNPAVEARLLEEIDTVLGTDRPPTEADLARLPYTEAVFNEALRLYPPAHATNRMDKAPLQVGGYTIPANTTIFLSIFSAHHNPDVWPRAQEFIPERFMPDSPLHPEVCARVPNAHAPFGYGSRMCIGWKFAVQEAKVALARLYQRLRFELEPGQVPLKTTVGITLSPKGGLWVRPVLRRQPPAAVTAGAAQ